MLSAAKHLVAPSSEILRCAQHDRVRSVRLMPSGRPQGPGKGDHTSRATARVAPTIRRVGLLRLFIVRVDGCLSSTRVIYIPVSIIYESTCARVLWRRRLSRTGCENTAATRLL